MDNYDNLNNHEQMLLEEKQFAAKLKSPVSEH